MRSAKPSRLFVVLFLVILSFRADANDLTLKSSAGLVVADSELASAAGMEILKRGGNAVDAAIATAFALSVVDQASSGLGGGGFMVIYRAKDQKSFALDFRETAPRASSRELYMKDGKPVASLSLTGALAVGVPGEVAGLVEARKRFGTLSLATLVAPAVKLASDGFPLDATLRIAIERQQSGMKRFADLGRIFMPNGEVPKEGDVIRQAELAETLKVIAQQGAEIFYQGRIAEAIAETIKNNGGVMTLEDLKNYKAVWREPLIGTYRNRTIVTMPPPSSGGVALLEMLNILEGYKLDQLQHNSPAYLHLITETMKHAFADRAQFLGDPDFVHVPIRKLTSKDYALWMRGQSVNTRFGSKLIAARTGIVLNNEMDDFAIHSGVGNVYGLVGNEANSLQPNKRPLSSMSPTIILQNGRPELVVGAAGGPRIISATLQTILNVIDFHMPVGAAVEAPRIHHQWLPERLNVETKIGEEARKGLAQRGHTLRQQTELGVVQAITWQDSTMSGVADSRKTERARTE